MSSRRSRNQGARPEKTDIESALAALTAEELRSCLREALPRLDTGAQARVIDAVLARAARGSAGWKPASPSDRAVAEVKSFADAARRVGQAEPEDVDAYLRRASRAFLAGNPVAARAMFEALLLPVLDADIDLGQDEMVEEVLSADVEDAPAQYVVSVYVTTPLDQRPEALCGLWTQPRVESRCGSRSKRCSARRRPPSLIWRLSSPWTRYLEGQPVPERGWEGDHDALGFGKPSVRVEGPAGLERIARKTKQPSALRAWCAAMAESGEWAQALRACETAAKLIREPRGRAEFLDGAARARISSIGLMPVPGLSPPGSRIHHWSVWSGGWDGQAGSGSPGEARPEGASKVPCEGRPPTGAAQPSVGNPQASADLLARAPGLGWSSDDHPGRLLFPAFALLLEDRNQKLSPELLAGVREPREDFGEFGLEEEVVPANSSGPSVAELIDASGCDKKLRRPERAVLFDAMRAAATRRVEGIVKQQRRSHYGSVAQLVACCQLLAPTVDKEKAITAWIDGLRDKYSRFHAFQKELAAATAPYKQ